MGDRLKITFDTWALESRFRNQGTYVYARSLMSELKKAVARLPWIEFCAFAPRKGCNDAALLEPAPGFSIARSPLLDHDRLWRMGGASAAARRVSAELMFSPSCNVLPLGSPPMVCTIHDVTPMVMPCHSRRIVLAQRCFLRAAARGSRALITVSECSKRDLVEICDVPEDKISVVNNGYDREFFNDAPVDPAQQRALRERLGIQRPYLVHHGVIQPRKNLNRLIEAYRLLLSRQRELNLDLVIAGPLGWQYQAILAAGEDGFGGRGQVLFPGTLGREDLAVLVKGASLVVIPSLYEGFCIPMVESMACGMPAIVSDNSCFREISANALLYFDPLSIEDMAAKMESALFDSELRKQIRSRGLQRASDFSWERCGRETLEVLLRAAGRELGQEARA